MDAFQSSTNHSLQAELQERTEQYNQLWLGCHRQFAEMERLHVHTVQQLQLELANVKEGGGLKTNPNGAYQNIQNSGNQIQNIQAGQVAPLHSFVMHQQEILKPRGPSPPHIAQSVLLQQKARIFCSLHVQMRTFMTHEDDMPVSYCNVDEFDNSLEQYKTMKVSPTVGIIPGKTWSRRKGLSYMIPGGI